MDDDMARSRVLYAMDGAIDCGVNRAILKGEVTVGAHGAILHDEVLTIAQRLFARNVATHESQILGVPTKVFAVDFRIIDSNVLGLPKSILGVEESIVNLYIAAVLEGIVTILMIAINMYIIGMHEEVVGILDTTILDVYTIAIPECFQSICKYTILHIYARHTAEHLRCLYVTALHDDIPTVPQRRTGTLGKETVCNPKSPTFPKDILTLEATMFGLDISGFLDG